MATTVPTREEMLATAARHDRLLLVLHPWRHHPAVIALRDAIVAGELGRVVRTHGYGVHADWGPGGWFTDPALAGGGALVDMGIHAIDTARFLLGEPEARRVRASITTAHGRLRGRRRRPRADRVGGRRPLGRRVGLVAAAPRRPRGRHRGLREPGLPAHLGARAAAGLRPLRRHALRRAVARRAAASSRWQPGTDSPTHGLRPCASASRPTSRQEYARRMPADSPSWSPASPEACAAPRSIAACCAPRSRKRPTA